MLRIWMLIKSRRTRTASRSLAWQWTVSANTNESHQLVTQQKTWQLPQTVHSTLIWIPVFPVWLNKHVANTKYRSKHCETLSFPFPELWIVANIWILANFSKLREAPVCCSSSEVGKLTKPVNLDPWSLDYPCKKQNYKYKEHAQMRF